MKTGKLDKRHNGHRDFKYYVQFSSLEQQKFVEVRNWCWQTWGPSAELDILRYLQERHDMKWAWICDNYNIRLYLKTDTEYQWFVLKWK